MPLYDVYAETAKSDRIYRVYSFTAKSDLAAEKIVTDRLTETAVQLWCSSRRVLRFEGRRPAPNHPRRYVSR